MNYESAIKKSIEFKRGYIYSRLQNIESFEKKHDLLLSELTAIFTIRMILIDAGNDGELWKLIKEWELEVRQMQDDLFKSFM